MTSPFLVQGIGIRTCIFTAPSISGVQPSFSLPNTMMVALIWPNMERFNQSIRDGSMDYTILQPVNSLYLVPISRMSTWRIWDLVLAIILIVVGENLPGGVTTPLSIFNFILLTISGAIVIYSLWIVLIAFTFWFTKFR